VGQLTLKESIRRTTYFEEECLGDKVAFQHTKYFDVE